MTQQDDLAKDLRHVADLMADAAWAAISPYFRQIDTGLANKAGDDAFDPVTDADKAAERAMRAVLADLRPDDAVLGEEEGTTPGTSGLTWVLDPIDGTRAFIAGAPSWGTLIAVNEGAAPIYGLIDQGYMGERFSGGFGRAELRRNGFAVPLTTRAPRPLSQAILMSTFPEIGTVAEREAFERVRDATRLTRYGMDCYGYALVALGSVDLVVEAGLQAYDIQGPMAVVQAAGGIVTNWQGGPAEQGGQVIAAANAEIHAEALALLRR